jgi:hypothetical protein
MQRFLILGSFLALAACGGGSSGGVTPLPSPTAAPTNKPASYTSKLVFTGSLAGAQIQGDLRRAESIALDDTATPIPVMVISSFQSGVDTSVYGGAVQAVVNPAPSASPPVTFAQTNPDAVMVTPNPSASPEALPTGVVSQVYVNGTNAVQAQSGGTASATIGAPVNETPTTPVYSYMSIALDCGSGPGGVAAGTAEPYTNHFGWQWTGTTWAPDDDTSTADVYIDGPGCVSDNQGEAQPTIHVPGGDTRLSTDTPFCSVLASQWVNSETSFVNPAISNPDGSYQLLIVGKTRDGHVFKIFPNHPFLFGAIETSGDSVDGF